MPRIPRRSPGGDDAPAPEDQRSHLSSGDPLAPPSAAPPSQASAGDPLTRTTRREDEQQTDLSAAPPVTPANTAAPSEAPVAPGDASSATAGDEREAAEGGGAATAGNGAATSGGGAATAGDGAATPGDATTAGEGAAQGGDPQPTVAAAPVEAPTTVLPVASGDPLATPAPAPQQPAADAGEVDAAPGEQAPADARPRFRQRTRMRRRLRYLRRLRELAFRDLGGLVFDLHRFGRERNDLVNAKLEALANIDRELRTLEERLRDRRDFTDLREAGIAACPRCGTLHDTDANFCPGCGTSLRTAIVRDASPVTVTPADDVRQQQATSSGS